jgi:thioredoxin 1
MYNKMVYIEMENELEEYYKLIMHKDYSDKLILAYFTAKWCGPCKMVSPIVKRIGEEKDSVVVIKVDVDDCSDISDNCEIECMPTFLFYKNNEMEPVNKISGADIPILVQNINNYLNEE